MTTASSQTLQKIVGASAAIRELREFIPKVAARDCSVLITGDTGTGKERVAEAIHCSSPRAHSNFVCINCAAIPDALLESELFGYERGAFTGAHARFDGRLHEAEGGTLFLDEIGDMSPVSQAKILRAIEQKQFYRVGGRTPEQLNIRVIAATHQDLPQMISAKQFRSDLYYRINVVNIRLPPLRERREDVALLFEHYMRELSGNLECHPHKLSNEALAALLQYDWPGNIRELKNLVELLSLESPREFISQHDLPGHMRPCGNELAMCERDRLVAALAATHWNKSEAAKQLQCSRMTLYRKMMKYDLAQSRSAPSLS